MPQPVRTFRQRRDARARRAVEKATAGSVNSVRHQMVVRVQGNGTPLGR